MELAKDKSNTRLIWLDLMKVIAMYFIIAGHCWVPYHEYIYVFSVPCFFIISGFLSHKESDIKIFWKKLLWNLIVPMLLFLSIDILFNACLMAVQSTFQVSYLWKRPLLSLVGMQGKDFTAGGLGVLWFVYTLCLCKIILQLISEKYKIATQSFLVILCLIIAVLINHSGVQVYNSIVNIALSYPFFFAGHLFRSIKAEMNRISNLTIVLLFILGAILVYVCGRHNDVVLLYECSYGSHLLLCLLGGFAGTAVVFSISKIFSQLPSIQYVSSILGGQ